MNRAQYMAQLSYLLQDMPDEERREVLQYYEDYFDEGGELQEELIIRTLGSPERLAAMIQDGVREGTGSIYGEYTDSGYRDERFREDGKVPQKYRGSCNEHEHKDFGDMLEDDQRKRRNKILLIVIVIVLAVTIGFRIPGILFVLVLAAFLNYWKEQKKKN